MAAQNSRRRAGGAKRGSNAKRRRGARQKAMQALYQWDFDQAANTPAHIIKQFCDMQNMEKVDIEYFESLFNYAVDNCADIDTEISRHLDRELVQLDPIERSVLRICCTELKTELATPYKVVVNEALEISKEFGADKGYQYINGVADKLAASLRSIEYSADHPTGNPLSEQTIREPAHKPVNTVKISMKEKPEEAPPPKGAATPASLKPAIPTKSAVTKSESADSPLDSTADDALNQPSIAKPSTADKSPDSSDTDQSKP